MLISRTFLIKQDGNFAHFWGGGKWWALACAITTTETPTTYKFCLFKHGDFELKTPACFAMPFGLGILLHRFFLSEIIICSFNNNELRNVPMAKLFMSCTGQCPVFLVAVTKFQDKFASLQQKRAKKRPKAGCVRAKIGLTRQLDRRQRGNYLKSYLSVRQK